MGGGRRRGGGRRAEVKGENRRQRSRVVIQALNTPQGLRLEASLLNTYLKKASSHRLAFTEFIQKVLPVQFNIVNLKY